MTSAPAEENLLAPSRGHLETVEDRLAQVESRSTASCGDLARRVGLQLRCGRHDAAAAAVGELTAGDAESRLLAARVLFAVDDYTPLVRLLTELDDEDTTSVELDRLRYRWWFLVDDLERVERTWQMRRGLEDVLTVDLLAAGRLAVELHDLGTARNAYTEALSRAEDDAEKATAEHGLATVAYRRQDFDGAFRHLRRALAHDPLDADVLVTLAHTLVRLGRAAETPAAAELAVRVAPYHEGGHYLLGNGYAHVTYSQLSAARPDAVAAAAAEARLGALAFAASDWAEARRAFRRALELCPGYGRAHNGLARTLEAQRLEVCTHRALYAARFRDSPEPQVPGIERLVVNLAELAPRHRKRVTLSVAPWVRWVPVLLEAGCTIYIKPLDERLSQAPGQHLLRDQRITYDARLWDDVRGCGGFSTVTSIEDVERTIWNGYDTVLHELTHQVHHILPAAEKRRIQELYRQTKERASTESTESTKSTKNTAFLSRYAGENVWEYFAEGANALGSPRRDRYDSRDVVRERLWERDPALAELVLELMRETPLDAAYSSAYVTHGRDRLRHGEAEAAADAFRRALERTPGDDDAVAGLAFALQVRGDTATARQLVSRAVGGKPASAVLALARADALWLDGAGLAAAIEALDEAAPRVDEDERHRLDLRLGALALTAGDAERARRAYEAVLAYQADNPSGLWGLAGALALAGDLDGARRRYDEAVRRRSGLIGLRLDYARDLLAAGDLDGARRQIDAALGLQAEDPEALALEARWQMAAGPVNGAAEIAGRALEKGPWCDAARLALAWAEHAAGDAGAARQTLAPLRQRIEDGDAPVYVYRPESGTWELAHDLPAFLRADVRELESRL